MAWLDDRAWAHPKLTLLSDGAFRAWVSGVCYSSGFGVGGKLEPEHQRLIGASSRVRGELVSAGLWDDVGEGAIVIHDWAEHNDKRDIRRAAARDRKRKQRDKARDSERDNQRDQNAVKEVKEVTVVKEVANATSTSGKRAPDELWEALIAELGDVTTKTERGERNAAHKELREAGATPEDVRARCRAYRRKWPEMALTASALKKHWSSLEGVKPRTERVEVPDRPEYSEEERLANLERVRGLTHSLGQEIA